MRLDNQIRISHDIVGVMRLPRTIPDFTDSSEPRQTLATMRPRRSRLRTNDRICSSAGDQDARVLAGSASPIARSTASQPVRRK
jgi:hypothetical protein